jgi:hypothetical protein
MRRGATALLVALALAGCGGSTKQPPAVAKPPRMPHLLAHTLAAQASSVAQALAQTDGCTAVADANALRDAVTRAIAAHEIPARLQPTLTAAVEALPGHITCNPAPQPQPQPPAKTKPPKPPKHGPGHGHGKHGKGGG